MSALGQKRTSALAAAMSALAKTQPFYWSSTGLATSGLTLGLTVTRCDRPMIVTSPARNFRIPLDRLWTADEVTLHFATTLMYKKCSLPFCFDTFRDDRNAKRGAKTDH